MNSKLVLWGTNAQDEKILVALELLTEENKVKILTFPDKLVIDEFYDKMRNDWRVGKPVELLEGHTEEIRDLTASDNLLPDHIKVERTDLIERKKLEWHVLVLSSKMYDQFKSELEGIKEKVDSLDAFDNSQWENLKSFWSKVQNQIRDGILSRRYADDLRKRTDELFDQLKGLRKRLDDEYRSAAKGNFDWFTQKLDELESRIEEGLKLSGVFNDLKELQRKFHKTKLTKEFRDKIWSRIDGSFKAVKEKKYGKGASNDNSALARLNSRYEGLIKAIKRSEYSRDRDLKDLEFEKRRIENTDGQLEAQIREAKIKMINQRLKFKEEKLKEMYATRDMLDNKMVKLKEKERLDKIRKEKEAEAKAKIQQKLKDTSDNLDDATKEKLAAAAEEINASKKGKEKKKDLMEKVMDTVDEVREMIEEKVDDAFISAKAAAVVISDEVSEKMEPYTEKGKEIVEDLTTKAGEKLEDVKEVFSSDNEESDTADGEKKGFFEKVMDKVDDVREVIEEKVDQAKDIVEEKLDDAKDSFAANNEESDTADGEKKGFLEKVMDKVDDVREAIEDTVDDAKDVVEEKIAESKEKEGFMGKLMGVVGDLKETVNESLEDLSDTMEPFTDKGEDILEDLTEKAKDVSEDVTDAVSDKIHDIKEDVVDLKDDILDGDDTPPKDA